MKVRKGNCRNFSIYKKNINENVFLELKGDTITYFKESNNNGPAKDFKSNIAPKLISDVNFVTQIIEELYTPVKKDIRHYKEELEAIEVESLTRVKNTATYTLRVLDEDFSAEFDLYITQTPQTIKEFCNQVMNMVENYLKDNSSPKVENRNVDDYKSEPTTLDELIKTNTSSDIFWQITLKQFFSKLSNVSEEKKVEFFKKLANDKEKFNEFSKEIMKNQNSNEVFNKYNI